jgi:hypothetical protein
MKRFLTLFLVLVHIICFGQSRIEMLQSYFIAPNDTVNYGDSVTLHVAFKNTGSVPYTGILTIQAKRDTTSGVSCGTVSYTLANFMPSDTTNAALSFTPTPGINAFKSGGNGNTIVVWPIVSNGLVGDSVRPVIWVHNSTGIREYETDKFKIYPNPVSQYMHINALQKANAKHLIVYDIFGRKVKELKYEDRVDLSDLSKGNYWLIIYADDKSHRIPFIKE